MSFLYLDSLWLSRRGRWLILSVALCVAAGTFFRFHALDRKVFWLDESLTAARVAGYSVRELTHHLLGQGVFTVGDLMVYQRLAPGRSVMDTVRVCCEDPHAPPLYDVLLRGWVGLFGMTVLSMRAFSAVASLAALPCVYFLCVELFGATNRKLANVVGLLALAVTALSPLLLLYAQEGRAYSLVVVAILAASLLMLKSIRQNSIRLWCWYAMSLAIGLYLHPFFLYVIVAHGIFVLLGLNQHERREPAKRFLLCVLSAGIAFCPWLWVVFTHRGEVMMDWFSYPIAKWRWLRLVGLNLAHIFVDLPVRPSGALNIIFPLVVLLEMFSLVFLMRTAPRRAWVLIFSLIVVPMLALMPADLILGGIRSTIARYFFSQLLAIEIAVVYCLAVCALSGGRLRRALAIGAVGIILFFEVVSDAMITSSDVWWNKGISSWMPPGAALINQAASPLVVYCYNNDPGNLLALAHLLKPNVRIEVVGDNQPPQLPVRAHTVFLYLPSPEMRASVANNSGRAVIQLDNLGILFVVR